MSIQKAIKYYSVPLLQNNLLFSALLREKIIGMQFAIIAAEDYYVAT
jgi:hypothetical protein